MTRNKPTEPVTAFNSAYTFSERGSPPANPSACSGLCVVRSTFYSMISSIQSFMSKGFPKLTIPKPAKAEPKKIEVKGAA
jgi:hypothetical protein